MSRHGKETKKLMDINRNLWTELNQLKEKIDKSTTTECNTINDLGSTTTQVQQDASLQVSHCTDQGICLMLSTR